MEDGQPFPDFVMGCARAFGALVMMRDEPTDAPIPEEFKPSDFSAKRMAEAKAERARLIAMNGEEALTYGEAQREACVARLESWIERDSAQDARLEDMEQRVNQWSPPSPTHQGLKDFMLQQIKISKHDVGYWRRDIIRAKSKPAIEYHTDAVESAASTIADSAKSQVEEETRAQVRNQWIKQLRQSLA